MLPDDILFMICEQLRLASDYNSLFNCSVLCKSFAAAALPNLWRIYEKAPCSEDGPDEHNNLPQWMMLWRTLILSSYPGKTYLSYLRYIRVLNLRDLDHLLGALGTRGFDNAPFFAGELQEFYKPFQKAQNLTARDYAKKESAISEIVAAIATKITEYRANLATASGRSNVLEELDCGKLTPEAVQLFVSQIPALQTVRVYNGGALAGTGSLIREKCPRFRSVAFYDWREDDNADEGFSEFLREIEPQTLTSLVVHGSIDSGELAASALGEHNLSLQDIQIRSARQQFVCALPLAGSCPKLHRLHLEWLPVAMVATPELNKEVGTWIASCGSLIDITISINSPNMATEIMTPVLQSNLRLVKLDVRHYYGSQAETFHLALSTQASTLEYLSLRGEPDDMNNEALVSSLQLCTKMRELSLGYISSYFSNANISTFVVPMSKLEELVVAGWNINDTLWPAMSTLRSLRRLDMNAYSQFTANGISGFIDTLAEGNKSFALNINGADPACPLYETEQTQIKDAIAAKVEGTFDYNVGRDPNADSDSESDSD